MPLKIYRRSYQHGVAESYCRDPTVGFEVQSRVSVCVAVPAASAHNWLCEGGVPSVMFPPLLPSMLASV
jgi:hypothetical protein